MIDPRYPVGTFTFNPSATPATRATCIRAIAEAPALLRMAVVGLDDRQLDTPYRPGGWTVREVVHHVPDSHVNAYCRFKFALTEADPTIKPYDEDAWARLADTALTPPDVSLELLDGVHSRRVALLKSTGAEDCKRTLFHPGRNVTLE